VYSEALGSPSWTRWGRGRNLDVEAWVDRFIERDDQVQCAGGSMTLSFGKRYCFFDFEALRTLLSRVAFNQV
jgi:hypothetical protein